MPNIEKHVPGQFCWVELATTEQTAAKDFYSKIFGWTSQDFPIGPNEVYTIFQVEGRDSAAGCTLRPDQLSHGVPPHWNLYIAVESADATAARATQLGGTVLAAPFDVFDSGRMAVIQDPTGATFCLWQPNKHLGTGISAAHGTLCWADLSTPDQARAGQFYSDLFGWQIMKEDEDPAHNYWHIKNGEEFIGGIPPSAHHRPGTPAHWMAYFTVSDCDATAAAAKNLGATLYMPPTDFEDVRPHFHHGRSARRGVRHLQSRRARTLRLLVSCRLPSRRCYNPRTRFSYSIVHGRLQKHRLEC